MKWEKVSFIFCADNNSKLMKSHAQNPIPLHIKDDIFRVYFGSRDENGHARPFFITLDLKDPSSIIDVNVQPVIELGKIGSFDENGIIITSFLPIDGKLWIYYIGFPRSAMDLYAANSGLAISDDGGISASKMYDGPIKSQNKSEPYFSTVQWVIHDDGLYKMWCVSGERWDKQKDDKLKHYYNIKYSESENGIDWTEGINAINFENKYEYAFGKPCVIKDGKNDYKMWYSYRAQKGIDAYRIGYAVSTDGLNWVRKDSEVGIDVSDSGWDDSMISYCTVFDHKDKRYMLYNGNYYGKTGFGLAVLRED